MLSIIAGVIGVIALYFLSQITNFFAAFLVVLLCAWPVFTGIAILSLYYGQEAPQVIDKVKLIPATEVSGNWVRTEDDRLFYIEKASFGLSDTILVEETHYRMGGWQGFWLMHLYNYPPSICVNFPTVHDYPAYLEDCEE